MGGEEKWVVGAEGEAFDTGSLSILDRKAEAVEEKSSSHSKPPPVEKEDESRAVTFSIRE